MNERTGLRQIVVVEDNPGDVFLIRHALDESGLACEVFVAGDADGALKHFCQLRADKEDEPDLIVLDLNLPGRDGISLLQEIRRVGGRTATRVAVLTSSDSPGDRERARAAGIDAYIRKPTHLDEFIEIGAWLKRLALGCVNRAVS